MELIKVGICLNDDVYAHALSTGLARECKNMHFILLKTLEDGMHCDLILSSEEYTDERIIALVREEENENVYGDPPYRIYRYKESPRLVNDLLFIFFKISGKNLEFTREVKSRILVFAGVAGGCGCTTVAITVGKMLYKLYGCKCLYLNLCPLNDSKRYLPSEGKNGLLTLLYYLDVKKDFPLGSFFVESEQLDYVHTHLMNSNFDEVHPHILNRLIEKIDDYGKYAFFIIDISNHFSRTNKQLLSRAFRIILLSKGEEKEEDSYLTAVFREVEKMANSTEILRVRNFSDSYENEDNLLSISRGKDILPEKEYEYRDLSSMTHFQMEIGRIVKKIMEEDVI